LIINRLKLWHTDGKVDLMLELKKGQYSGKVVAINDQQSIISSITTYDSNRFNGALHFHENIHVSFVIRGGCLERKKDSYDRAPGKLTFYAAGEPHQVLSVPAPSKHINLEIGQKFMKQYHLNEGIIGAAVTSNPDGKFLMLQIYKDLTTADKCTASSIQMLLLDFMHKGNLHAIIEQPSWIKLLYELLQDRWDENFSLEELSAVAGVHPVTVSKYFHRYFGCTLSGFMRKVKIERALALMATRNISLTQTALKCGFADQSHFIRIFKDLTGFLPKKYLNAIID
jgi:AraC family transcriptional regulator